VIQVEEAHLFQILVDQENIVWVQVGVDDVFLVQDVEQINDLNGDFNCFELAENRQFLWLWLTILAYFLR